MDDRYRRHEPYGYDFRSFMNTRMREAEDAARREYDEYARQPRQPQADYFHPSEEYPQPKQPEPQGPRLVSVESEEDAWKKWHGSRDAFTGEKTFFYDKNTDKVFALWMDLTKQDSPSLIRRYKEDESNEGTGREQAPDRIDDLMGRVDGINSKIETLLREMAAHDRGTGEQGIIVFDGDGKELKKPSRAKTG